MYALPTRQRRRNNYSRTLLADRDGDMLPHLSTKQLLSVKELLISSGLVNCVVTRNFTLREILTFPTGEPYSGHIQYLVPVYQPGLRLIRTEFRDFDPSVNSSTVGYSLNSKPDRSGTVFGQTVYGGSPLKETAMIRWPTTIDPYLIFQTPINLTTFVKSNFDVIKSEPVSPEHLRYYPMVSVYYPTVPNPTDDVVLKCYYLN